MNMHVKSPRAHTVASVAMLGAVRIKMWSGRKLDRSVTDQVNRDHGAAADAGRYNKALVSRDALAELVTIANLARKEHYARTLPWHDDGSRILPAVGYLKFVEAMRELRIRFEAATDEFASGYDDFVSDAKARLNGMFNAADYPTAADIRRRFGFDVVILPMPEASDFRVDVGDAEADRIRADIQARTNAAIRDAMADVFGRVCEAVGHMAEKLADNRDGGKAAIFRDTLVDNVRELVALLPGLNVTADAALTALADRMARELLRFDATALRDDPAARADVAKAAASIHADAKAAADALAHVSEFMA